MLRSGISSRGSGVKSMTVADQDRRARKFGDITRKSSDLGPGLEQTRRVAAADPTVFTQREKRSKVRSAGFRAARLVLFPLPVTVVFVAGCGSPKAASSLPSPEVEVASVVQKDVPTCSVSQINPIKAYFSISELEYIHFADRINAETQKETPTNGPPFELILADGSLYPHKGTGLLTNRQVDVTTGSIQIVCSFPNPQNFLRPGQFGRLRAAPEIRYAALLVPQKAVSELQGSYQLAIVGLDNKVSIRAVTVGDRIGPLWIVESGVKAGELVVVEGLQKVQNGATVKIEQPKAKGD